MLVLHLENEIMTPKKVKTDSEGRIYLGAIVKDVTEFKVNVTKDLKIILEPLVKVEEKIPEFEKYPKRK